MNVLQNIENVEMFATVEIKKLLHLCFLSALISKDGEVSTTN